MEGALAFYQALAYAASPRYDDPLQKAEIVLLRRAGSPLVELIRPTTPDSPAMGWLKRMKAGPYHTCYEVADLGQGISLCQSHGFSVTSKPVPAVAFGLRPVVFLWSNEVGLLELLQAE
jgi:methylmalonyl-CoA/ethylmalonyl-CoA epimerase